jgi:all-trans-retinol 13,14-reductase
MASMASEKSSSSLLSGLDTPLQSVVSMFAVTAIATTSYVRLKQHVEALSKRNNNPDIRKKRSLLHEKFSMLKVPDNLDYIVIGSGMGGLSCAAVLARLGKKVLVLEQHHDVAGGGTHMFDMKGFTFDSGLHYTVPWSQPLFALTCLKKPKDCIPFDLMTEKDGTIERVFLVDPEQTKLVENSAEPFRVKYKEPHLEEIYRMFPDEKEGIDKYIEASNNSMHFVKVFLLSKLFPKWLQDLYWAFIPSKLLEPVVTTAKDLLPRFIKSKKLISLLSSMWIDTGARPDRASFMLTASVFRGIPMEGGCYPRGGSTEMAKELVTVIESNGGKVLIRADVAQVLFDSKLQKVSGVRLRDGKEILAKQGVISSSGYLNTMNNLVPKEVLAMYNVPSALPCTMSAGFVMANIGINCAAEVIGATKANTWHIPVDDSGDAFAPMDAYFRNPLQQAGPVPAFITFPSLKDTAYEQAGSKTSCQMLLMAEYDWFKEFSPNNEQPVTEHGYVMDISERRMAGYNACKEQWKERCLQIFLRYFPKAKEHIAMVDISTPLSIQYYLRATQGGAVGLDVTPNRFADPQLRQVLDPITNIPGLALTGQDVSICGVTLCQLSGVITALRLEGLCAAIRILAESIILGN